MNNNQQHQQQNMQQVGGSGLTRYRSAPSSYFASILDTPGDGGFGGDDFEQLFNPRASSPETQKIFSRFMNSGSVTIPGKLPVNTPMQSQPLINSQFLSPPRNDAPPVIVVQQQPQNQLQRQQNNDYSSVSQMIYQDIDINPTSAMDNSYSMFSGSNRVAQIKMESSGGGGDSWLIRHSSSPAGLFANLDIEKEIGAMRNMETFGAGNSSNAEASVSSPSRFNNTQMDFSSGFTVNSWDDSKILSDTFLNVDKTFANADAQNNESGQNRPKTRLAHHLSMPTSSADFSAMDKLLEDSVPCKLRAKRGCATHPRSIAERVRRTKISERMRKLQELVPNMDKQTNTSDMLDLSVEYIKELQSELKRLTHNRSKCSCSAIKQKS